MAVLTSSLMREGGVHKKVHISACMAVFDEGSAPVQNEVVVDPCVADADAALMCTRTWLALEGQWHRES